MTTTESFAALMPEPAHVVHTRNETGEIKLYTAEHLRAMFDAATERAAKQEREDGVCIVSYALPTDPHDLNEVRIERARQIEGPALWAVRRSGDVLNKQGEWEWEPRPSLRDDDFLARARFATADEAIAAAIRARDEGVT
ncbi:hypothetical protein CY658_04780 [Variovorax sp. RO1]|uniref:hypothetical protein n=1 Tax=Variovorax sp. RO1 TaxID=2066034 RepID=UPI000C71785A|nr:hypothetical protein [Variovorax sp. RO1]PLC06351.1 hypothetical protein CY658_04780 [Variovorax sp. RO1]